MVLARGANFRSCALMVTEPVKRLQEPLPATFPGSKKESVGAELRTIVAPASSTSCQSEGSREKAVAVGAGPGAEAAAGDLWEELQDAASRVSSRKATATE